MNSIPTINMIKTGQNITYLRQKCGVSVKELQAVFGFATPQAIYKWQNGTTLPTVDNLIVLAAVFQVHIEEILVVDSPEGIRSRAGTVVKRKCLKMIEGRWNEKFCG